jgi:hypothetical protein
VGCGDEQLIVKHNLQLKHQKISKMGLEQLDNSVGCGDL